MVVLRLVATEALMLQSAGFRDYRMSRPAFRQSAVHSRGQDWP
jgi:hypothetical protein